MEIIHGGDVYTAKEMLKGKILDFSANINPLGLQEAVKQAIINSIEDCENYPDIQNRKLRKAISEYENVAYEHIICGNGSADLIFRLIYALKPAKAMVLAPTFAEYECALQNTQTQVVYHELKEENDFQLTDDILEELTPDIDLLFICNPNNPTGQAADSSLMRRILKACSSNQIRLVVDECFMDFVLHSENYSLKAQLTQYPNLFILKAFTKIFAMPGIRLGYALCSDKKILEQISQSGQPWSVSTLAENAGVAALLDKNYVADSKKNVEKERAYLSNSLKEMGIKVYDAKANYIMFRLDKPFPLKEKLFDQGILIRSCENYHGLDGRYYRIAIKNHDDNEKLIKALNKFFI